MPNLETQAVDTIIASRRAMLLSGGAALAALLNFALNLEYLEANFYYLACFGANIYTTNSAATSAGATLQLITGTGTQGTVTTKPTSTIVPWTNPRVKALATETAVSEGRHVNFLRSQLGPAAVAMPAINLYTAFNTLAAAAGIGATFDPFASDANFLLGAYIFEDVGVTAYNGALPLFTTTDSGKGYMEFATRILATEAYHAGYIRTTLNNLDPTGSLGYLTTCAKISTLRATLAHAVASTTANSFDTNPDDTPPTPGTTTVSLEGATSPATTIADTDPVNAMVFARTTTQVLNIVTGGGAAVAGTKASGVFFPSGLNGTFS
jgi:hypothetical protein